MAIQQLGESLLADVRKRRDEEAKAERKRKQTSELLGAAASIGIKMGNAYLESQAKDFFKNEKAWSSVATTQGYMGDVKQAMTLQDTIKKDGKTTAQYVEDQAFAELQARAIEQFGEERVNTTAYQTALRGVAQQLAKDGAKSLESAFTVAEQAPSADVISEYYQNVRDKVRPKNISGWLARKASNFFQGKSESELEDDMLLALSDTPWAKNSARLDTFMEEYNRSQDLISSYDFADLIIEERTLPEGDKNIPDEERYQRSETEEVVKIGDVGYVVTTEYVKDKITGKETKRIKRDAEGRYIGEPLGNMDVSGIDLSVSKTLNTLYNFVKDGKSTLRPEAFKDFAREVKDEGLNITAPKNVADFYKIADIYDKYIQDDKNLINTFVQEQALVLQETLMSEDGLSIKALIAELAKNPDRKDELTKQLTSRVMNLFSIVDAYRQNASTMKQE